MPVAIWREPDLWRSGGAFPEIVAQQGDLAAKCRSDYRKKRRKAPAIAYGTLRMWGGVCRPRDEKMAKLGGIPGELWRQCAGERFLSEK